LPEDGQAGETTAHHAQYKCRRCGRPKRGHVCPATSGPTLETAAVVSCVQSATPVVSSPAICPPQLPSPPSYLSYPPYQYFAPQPAAMPFAPYFAAAPAPAGYYQFPPGSIPMSHPPSAMGLTCAPSMDHYGGGGCMVVPLPQQPSPHHMLSSHTTVAPAPAASGELDQNNESLSKRQRIEPTQSDGTDIASLPSQGTSVPSPSTVGYQPDQGTVATVPPER
jgi:hypothetical protein